MYVSRVVTYEILQEILKRMKILLIRLKIVNFRINYHQLVLCVFITLHNEVL